MAKANSSSHYLVHYRDPKDGKIVALKCGRIADSTLGLSFVKISDFIFETGSALVQPAEEALRMRFENVRSLHLSIYSIVSVEEVGQGAKRRGGGGLKFKKTKSNLISFPSDLQSPK